jgi:NADPH:quinone reductase-like Zn-dependent oxidoreductase
MREHGGPEVLRAEDVADPEPGTGEVLVRVRAVAVNRLDLGVRENVAHAYVVKLPLIPGYDVTGEIVDVGSGVSGLAAGERVYVHYDYSCGRCEFCLDGDESLCAEYGIMGVDHDGGYAELVVAPARNIFPLAPGVSFEAAAAAGSVYLTAYHMLFARAGLRAGESVLVTAAGSGVGGAALELARVLRPGGRLVFLEHVLADDPKLARWQDRFQPIQFRLGHGCHCNRATLDNVKQAGFMVAEVEKDMMKKAPPMLRPLIVGTAER